MCKNTRVRCFLSVNINSFVNITCHPQNLKITLSSGKILGYSPKVSVIQGIKGTLLEGQKEVFLLLFFIVSFKKAGTSTTSHLKHIMKLKLGKLGPTLILALTDGSIHPVNAPPIMLLLSVTRIGHNFPRLLMSLSFKRF